MITEDTLLRQPWRFSRSLGQVIHPAVEFLSNGGLRPGGPAEAGWRLSNGVLELCDMHGTATTRFERRQVLKGGGIRLAGRFLPQPDLFLYHFLDTADAPLKESRLNVSMSLSGESDTVLVIFNSAGRPSEGWDSRWEFYRLPGELGLDHVRFAEMRAPTVFYLDKTKAIRRTLGTVFDSGYRRVLITGMSSGGYIGMLIAELMCADFPNVEFLTFGINPQTTQAPEQARAFSASAPLGMAPVLLSDYAYALRDSEETGVAELARRNPAARGNVRHTVFYDSRNPVEAGYTQLIANLPGVTLHPQPLGLPHMQSCMTLFNAGVLQEAMRAAIKADPLP